MEWTTPKCTPPPLPTVGIDSIHVHFPSLHCYLSSQPEYPTLLPLLYIRPSPHKRRSSFHPDSSHHSVRLSHLHRPFILLSIVDPIRVNSYPYSPPSSSTHPPLLPFSVLFLSLETCSVEESGGTIDSHSSQAFPSALLLTFAPGTLSITCTLCTFVSVPPSIVVASFLSPL